METVKTFSDAELLANLRSGKRMDECIGAIYRDYFDSLSWYVMNNSGSRQDAEDLFQEVVVSFIDLVQKDKFRGDSSVKTFLFSLNRHGWLNELKRRGRALAREEKFEKGQERADPGAEAYITRREERNRLVELIGKLGETCKKILVWFYYEERSIADILKSLHYENEQVVRNKKSKCLKQLAVLINQNPALKQTLKNILNG